jgi:hypothetical protein
LSTSISTAPLPTRGIPFKGVIEDERGRPRAGFVRANSADQKTTVAAGSDAIFVGGDSARVAWTLDNGPVQQTNWNVCVSNHCAALVSGNGIPFLKTLFDKSLLKITINRYDGQQVRGTFTITGAKAAYIGHAPYLSMTRAHVGPCQQSLAMSQHHLI